MVELSVCPQHGVMACVAGGRESRCDMVHRRDGFVVVSLMTRDTSGAGQVVIVVDVTIAALAGGECGGSGQREPTSLVVKGVLEPGQTVEGGETRCEGRWRRWVLDCGG